VRGEELIYPLAALSGQESMRDALLLIAVDPSIGGLLLVGEKGTAKSTAARALSEILPSFPAYDCPYHCMAGDFSFLCPSCLRERPEIVLTRPPFRTIPLGVTEERLLGGVDFERTMREGRPILRQGILGEANNGLAYIDEVNLLDPSLAHLMLDAVSSGRVVLEREGFSFVHPARVALLGSMNPEEGPLGPQLLDRFGLTVELRGETDRNIRAEIVRRRLAFEEDPKGFRDSFQKDTDLLRENIVLARRLLPLINVGPQALQRASRISSAARAQGHRADLALCLAARALAALTIAREMGGELSGILSLKFPDIKEVGDRGDNPDIDIIGAGPLQGPNAAGNPAALGGDFKALRDLPGFGDFPKLDPMWVERVAGLVIASRRRLPEKDSSKRTIITDFKPLKERPAAESGESVYVVNAPEIPPEWKGEDFSPDDKLILHVYESAGEYSLSAPKVKKEKGVKDQKGRRGVRETLKARGRAYKTTARRLGRPLSLSATLRAAAPNQRERARLEESLGNANHGKVILRPSDFREKVYRLKTGRLVIFVVDSSGSIGTLYRMEEAKAAALSLLTDAYQKRDRVAIVAFYGASAELLLPPTNSPDLAGRLLAALPSGGKTPLSSALALTHKLLKTERSKDPMVTPFVILMTDGRPNIPLDPKAEPWKEVLRFADLLAEDPTLNFLLIDTDRGAYNEFKLTRELAQRLKAPKISLEDLREGTLEKWLNHEL
jgi:magnesium chelatase subunit D